MSISELDRILEHRWPGKVRRGGALALENRERFLLFKKRRQPVILAAGSRASETIATSRSTVREEIG